jgi:hypothetical protein
MLLGTGDTFFGGPVTSIALSGAGALDPNGSGNLAFLYFHGDFAGVAIAKPVPEPPAVAVALFCLLFLCARRDFVVQNSSLRLSEFA